jgi:hypothetical protein
MHSAAVARSSLLMEALVRAVAAGPAGRSHPGFCLQLVEAGAALTHGAGDVAV